LTSHLNYFVVNLIILYKIYKLNTLQGLRNLLSLKGTCYHRSELKFEK
jgi:hypothetical protein